MMHFNGYRHTREYKERLAEAMVFLGFCAELYTKQLKEGRFFIHEHPHSAESWKTDPIKQLAARHGMLMVRADMCMYGLSTKGTGGDAVAAMKPTRFLTNSPAVACRLQRRCDNSHEHKNLLDGRAKFAQEYTEELCDAMLEGIKEEKEMREMGLSAIGAIREEDINKKKEDVFKGEYEEDGQWMECWDEVTGKSLDPKLVMKARAEEMGYFCRMRVYTRVPRAQAFARTGRKPIRVKWVDVNKGSEEEPNYRSRLVAAEIRTDDKPELFAGTPPTEAMRYIISKAATGHGAHGRRIMVIDVKRAYFFARATREIYVELPDEDKRDDDVEPMCGLLNLSLYGTRDAAKNWAVECEKTLGEIGFEKGISQPGLYRHEKRDMALLIHGDDFMIEGRAEDLQWVKSEISKRYDIKAKVIGLEEGEHPEAMILNRVVRRVESGYEMEADPRHAEIVVKALGLESGKGQGAPGIKDTKKVDGEGEILGDSERTLYRSIAARINYLAIDRADLQYAAKEVCRVMGSPTQGDWIKLKRIGRFLKMRPRLVMSYPWQQGEVSLKVYSDTDWAGCEKTRRSTSGGIVMRGIHYIRSWAKTQAVVALSSGEAELHGIVKAAAEGIGTRGIGRDLGDEVKSNVLVYADASAAIGMIARQGVGKIRHLDTRLLWVQESNVRYGLDYAKVKGTLNPADAFTKYVPAEGLENLLRCTGMQWCCGRPGVVPGPA